MSNWSLIFLPGLETYQSEWRLPSDVIILSWAPENTAHYAQSTHIAQKTVLAWDAARTLRFFG
jgi:hypothetical protein